MRKALIPLLLFVSFNSYSQIETIEKIGNLVLPVIERIFSPNTSNRQKKAAKNELPIELKNALSELKDDSDKLKRFNDIFKVSGNLFDDIGAMESLTNNFFLERVLQRESQDLNINIAIRFNEHLRQIKSKQSELKSASTGSAAGTIGRTIFGYNEEIGEQLELITTRLSTVDTPTENMGNENAKTYVEKMRELQQPITVIKTQSKNINRELISYFETLHEKFLEFDKKTKEATKSNE